MKEFQVAIAVVTSIILFIFGLENFSKEIQRVTGEKFRKFLTKATRFPPVGLLIGAIITAFIQSSSATSIIAISLVNAGVLSFKHSVGIIFGSNIGTTVTAQLIAFKLTSFAPIFIIIGFILSFVRTKYSIFGKSLFYFGFVFFSLNLISSTLDPLQHDPRVLAFLSNPQSPFLSLFIGFIVTAIIQSSSVTTGLAIILTQQGLLSMDNAIPILMGANIGTTTTALISIVNMDIAAKKTALSHFLFNLGGVILFLPWIFIPGLKLPLFSSDPAIALANFHLIFNISTSLIFIALVKPFTVLIDKILGEGKMDFERLSLDLSKEEGDFQVLEAELFHNLNAVYKFLQENYSLVTLSIETNYKSVYEASKKRIEYLDFVKNETQRHFALLISKTNDEAKLKKIIQIISFYEYIFQIHDSIKDLIRTKDAMSDAYIELKSDLLLVIRELSGRVLSFFDDIAEGVNGEGNIAAIKEKAEDLQQEIENFNKDMLKLMTEPDRKDVSFILHILTYSQRLKDKLLNYHSLRKRYAQSN